MISLFCGVFADVFFVDRKLPCFGVFCNCCRKQSYLLCLLRSPTKKRYQIQWLHIDNFGPVKILMLPRDCKLNENMRKQIKSYTTRKNMDDNLKLRKRPGDGVTSQSVRCKACIKYSLGVTNGVSGRLESDKRKLNRGPQNICAFLLPPETHQNTRRRLYAQRYHLVEE